MLVKFEQNRKLSPGSYRIVLTVQNWDLFDAILEDVSVTETII